MWSDNLTANLVNPLRCNELLRHHVEFSHNHVWKVHGVYERSQTRKLREIGRTSALRVREVTSHQHNARVAPMHNRCSKIDQLVILNCLRTPQSVQRAVHSHVGTSQNGCSFCGARLL